MLVLSRRENQKILFPKLGITVEIIGVKGKNVRVGIDAPPEIRILRSELFDETAASDTTDDISADQQQRHERANFLNSVSLQIQLAQKLMKRGDHKQAMETLAQSLEQLRCLEENVQPEISDSTISPSETNLPKPKWRALLVEDDENERQLMASILRMCGFDVDAVEDGIAAIDYLNSHDKPDCVLMDMQMPRLSGPETISSIRAQLEFCNIPIYGVSGLQRHEAKVPLGERGVTGWFDKPIDAEKMLRQIFADFQETETVQSALN